MKKITVILLTVLLMMLCACNNNRIYGKWHCDGNTVVFEKNGNFEMLFWDGEHISGMFNVTASEDNRIFNVLLTDEKGRKQEVEIVIDGNSMTLPNGIYKKQ